MVVYVARDEKEVREFTVKKLADYGLTFKTRRVHLKCEKIKKLRHNALFFAVRILKMFTET